jgi:hypothetical protein
MAKSRNAVTDLISELAGADFNDPRAMKRAVGAEAADALLQMGRMLADDVLTPNLPRPGETAAIAPTNPKTAALCFDRIWMGFNTEVPKTIGFRGATPLEIQLLTLFTIGLNIRQIGDVVQSMLINMQAFALFWEKIGAKPGDERRTREVFTRGLADELFVHRGVTATPSYDSERERNLVYQPGSYDVIVASITHVPVVDENTLSWEQVVELRSDKESRKRFRRFVHWFDKELVGRPVSFISDEINERLEAYRSAVKKHGVSTTLGTLSSILDSKLFIGGSVAGISIAAFTNSLETLMAMSGLAVAGAAVHVAKTLVDRGAVKNETHPEIAFVVEAQDRVGKTGAA